MSLYQLGDFRPRVAPTAWLAPTAQIIGNVQIDAYASVWFNVVIRADNDLVHIGEGSNVQDGTMIHLDQGYPVIISPNVVVGHMAMLHSCVVGENSLIGMGATLLSRSRIGRNSIVAAGSLVTEGKEFPDGVLIMGSPAKVVRELTEKDFAMIQHAIDDYREKGARYSRALQEIYR